MLLRALHMIGLALGLILAAVAPLHAEVTRFRIQTGPASSPSTPPHAS